MTIVLSMLMLALIIAVFVMMKFYKNAIWLITIIIALVAAIAAFFIFTRTYNKNNFNDALMKVSLENYEVGYNCTVYIYSNHEMIIEPNYSYKYGDAKRTISPNVDVERLCEILKEDNSKSQPVSNGYYYRVTIYENGEEGTIRYIPPKDVKYQKFINELPVELFAQLK